MADYLLASQLIVWFNPQDAWKWGALIWTAQKTLDCYPVMTPLEQEKMADETQAARERKKEAMAAQKPMTRKQAQAAYIGERIPLSRKDPYKGNILHILQ